MNKLFLFLLLFSSGLLAQTDTAQSDSTLKYPPGYYGGIFVSMVEYFQEYPWYVVIAQDNGRVLKREHPPVPIPIEVTDSAEHINYTRLDSFYRACGFRLDTIIFLKAAQYDRDDFLEPHTKSVTGYFFRQKHGREVTYYTIREISDTVITGRMTRIKSIGHWRLGKKHGRWNYYSTTGELVKTERWKRGELKWTRPPGKFSVLLNRIGNWYW